MPTQDWERKASDSMARIEESEEICERNKELIREYRRDQVLHGLSVATLSRNLNRLKVMAVHLGDVAFDDLDRDGVKDLVEWLYTQDYTDSTVDTYKTVIRSFWRWMDPDEDGEAPAEVSWIKIKGSSGNGTLPKDLLTKEDIKAQVAAANNARDKAFIWLLYETGARIGELIDLTVGDIEDRRHGKKVVIDGKTGARRLPLVESVPHLNKWLNEHPNPEKDAPLWCKLQQNGPTGHLNPHEVEDIEEVHGIGHAIAPRLRERGIVAGTDLIQHTAEELADIQGVKETKAQKWLDQFNAEADLSSERQLGYRYITDKILGKTMNEAGIEKPSNPHHYRHSRASYLANELKEAQLCEWFGWVQGSDVPAKYVHLSGRDIDNAYDQMHGLYEPEEDGDEPQVRECPRCEELNESDAKFCSRCGQALDVKTAAEIDDVQQRAEDRIPEVESDAEARVVAAVLRELRENPADALGG